MAQDADAKRKIVTTIGIATGVSVGTIALVVCLSLGVCLHKRRNKRKTAQRVQTAQHQTTADSPAPPHSQPMALNTLDFSQQHNQVSGSWDSSEPLATVPPWATDTPSFERSPTYSRSPVQTSMPPSYFEGIGTSTSPLQPEQELGADWGEKKVQSAD